MSTRISLISLALLTAAMASADVSFSTFGAGDSFNGGLGYGISTPTSGLGLDSFLGQQFTSATSGDLSAISVATFLVNGSGDITLGIYADDGTGHMGVPLGTWNVNTPASPSAISTFSIAPGISLSAGQKYWLGMSGNNDTWAAWLFNDHGATGLLAPNFSGPSTFSGTLSAFRIETQAVPEPTTIAALTLGAAGLLCRRKRA